MQGLIPFPLLSSLLLQSDLGHFGYIYVGLKPHIPKTRYKIVPKPLQNGIKTLLVFGFHIVLTALRLASSTTSPKILGHFIKTTQLSRSCYPAPTGPQHSLVACPRATYCCMSLLLFTLFNDLVCLIEPLGVNILQFVVHTFHFCDASFDMLQRFPCNFFCEQFTHCGLCLLELCNLGFYLHC